jgi:hypothetical protein
LQIVHVIEVLQKHNFERLHNFKDWACRLTPVIPTTQEVRIRRIEICDQPKEKVNENLISINKSDVLVHICSPSYKGDMGRESF